jgi:hypothetical protein
MTQSYDRALVIAENFVIVDGHQGREVLIHLASDEGGADYQHMMIRLTPESALALSAELAQGVARTLTAPDVLVMDPGGVAIPLRAGTAQSVQAHATMFGG